MELVVVFAECEHGRPITGVAVQQAHGTWAVEARYACDEGCADREAGADMPATVIDTEGTVRWTAP